MKYICVVVIYFGYGFLLENVEFVEVVVGVGLVWIGVFVVVICVMGYKDVVKWFMMDVGVFVMLGYFGED